MHGSKARKSYFPANLPVRPVRGNARVAHAQSGVVKVLYFDVAEVGSIQISIGPKPWATASNISYHLHAEQAFIDAETFGFTGISRWVKHPKKLEIRRFITPARIADTWAVLVRKEIRMPDGTVESGGFRSPQLGALHALQAHWTLGNLPALVVLPTGTGKTEVMLAAMLLRRPQRLLVLVPTDALRKQTTDKFCYLGILPKAGVVTPKVKSPIVGTLLRIPRDEKTLSDLRSVNVCVSTVAMVNGLADDKLDSFLSLFDTVFFDEAHHAPATSWSRISEKIKCALVGFTATPFRTDGARIAGKVVYQFPLRLAQEQGYFQSISFKPVDEPDRERADLEIARLAIEQLRADIAKGNQHILLARTATVKRAQYVYDHIYSVVGAEFSPALIYSGVRGKSKIAAAIREGKHRIIVCVDMFGEGFDLPALKIAAMHDIHRSLAITLQFAGRFTRSDGRYGTATLIANLSEPNVQEAIEDLYAEDADWNTLIPALSAKAIGNEHELETFVDQMRADGPDEGAFGLAMLRPKTSAVMYKVREFAPRRFRAGLPRGTKVHRVWANGDKALLVFITRSTPSIGWARIKEVTDEVWDLYILLHEASTSTLYIYSSQTTSLHSRLAKAVSRQSAQIVDGERMFRSLAEIRRLVFHNVGLYGRGKLRFRMFTGYDISEAISPTTQANATKSNIFGVGYEYGKLTTIGVSAKGRFWAMTSSSIPQWTRWVRAVSQKIFNADIKTDAFLAHTLIPKQLTTLPNSDVISILLPDEWLLSAEDLSILAGVSRFSPAAAGIVGWSRDSDTEIVLTLAIGSEPALRLSLRWREGAFAVTQLDKLPAYVDSGEGDIPIGDYFSENPVIILLADGSEIRGDKLLERRAPLPRLFEVSAIRTLDWSQVPLRLESKWKNGIQRESSVQGQLIKERLLAENTFVFDDDDTGEIADVIELIEADHELIVRLYHCKYSSADNAGVRVDDLYVVCGQAIRSTRVAHDPRALLEHMEARESAALLGGRATRFEKGTLRELRRLRRRLPKLACRFEIIVVQPGLKRSALTPNAGTLLAAADMFVREFTANALVVYASP